MVGEGDTLSLGKHNLTFVLAPMVHWPEVMVTYEKTEKILFSADAFGSFGAVDGNIFADEIDDKVAWLSEARRYYTNIVGKIRHVRTGSLKEGCRARDPDDLPAPQRDLERRSPMAHR